MKKNYNFNYIFLFYDIKEERVNKVFKVCKRYLNHYQKSVFRGQITPSNIILLEQELRKVAVKGEDFISIIKLINENAFVEDCIGKVDNNTGNSFFI